MWTRPIRTRLAHAVNAGAPAAFAEALRQQCGRMLQLSTDFVFSGSQGSPIGRATAGSPWRLRQQQSQGEEAVEAVFEGTDQATILRTSWVIGPVGRNFALTMLRLHRDKDELGVADQLGCPSSTLNLATACWSTLIRAPRAP